MHSQIFRFFSLAVVGTSLAAWPVLANDVGSPVGTWIDASGRGAVEIAECGTKLCGKIVWLQSPKHASRCSLAIIGDVSSAGDGTWGGGWIYDPDTKSKFSVEIGRAAEDKLKVVGYAGSKLFSREMTWTRAPGDLTRCDTQPAQIAAVRPPVTSERRRNTVATPTSMSAGTAQPAEVAQAAPVPVKRARTATKISKSRGSETVKLAELRSFGLQNVTLRKGSGSCSLKISDFGRVAFPC